MARQPLLLFLFCFLATAAATTKRGQLRYITGMPETACAATELTPSSTHRLKVPLNHRDGPCSPSPVASEQRSLEELLRLDELRAADYVQRGVVGGLQPSLEDRVQTFLGAGLGTLEYVISIGIGSPPLRQTVILDTGSDLSWVRCSTEVGGPESSSSFYTPFPCSSVECDQLGDQGDGCSDGNCEYIVRYYDGSFTTGTYSSGTLAFTDAGAITGFRFGCSSSDNFDERLDGVLGFGGGALSLPSQAAAAYGTHFSYCLPPTPASSGFLALGAPDEEASAAFATTWMFRVTEHPTFYYVLLWGITVAEKTLDIPPSVFSSGSVLDSGTVITRLPTTAYAALSSAFKDEMKAYPPAQPSGILDTCFDFSGQDSVVMIPRVALVFDGGMVVDLDANDIMLGGCLAFAATKKVGIIGNVQLRTFEVRYDVGQGVVGFRPGAC